VLVLAGPIRADEADPAPAPRDSITHVAGSGVRLVRTDVGEVRFRLYTYVRYLNENALDDSYTDSFGQVKSVNTLQDIQVNKTILYFLGWVIDPRLRYLTYAWSSNSTQGQLTQVVVAGNLTYRFSERLALGFGITSLPGTFTTSGNWPMWLGSDNRVIADEFFRPSYTTGIWVTGGLPSRIEYQLMLGNNLNQFGIDAGQLDNDLSTFSGEIAWMPTTGEFGRGFTDFDPHEKVATRIGVHFTTSDEDRQSQPNTEAPDNVQLRLSDGNIIFTPGLFGAGIDVERALYHMAAVDAGAKLHGISFGGEYYWRRLSNFRGTNTTQLPFDDRIDQGVSWYASAMALPKTFEVYVRGSNIVGQYGDPWDARVGGSWYPWKNQTIRWHNEVMYFRHSPVGALSLPYVVGANGVVFNSNFEVNF
jgi:hypothetical protein